MALANAASKQLTHSYFIVFRLGNSRHLCEHPVGGTNRCWVKQASRILGLGVQDDSELKPMLCLIVRLEAIKR